MTTTPQLSPARPAAPDPDALTRSEIGQAVAPNHRINVPIDLRNWSKLDEATVKDLLWFHQHAIDKPLTWDECVAALGYDRSTIFRVLKGTYEGSWDNITRAIRSYKKLDAARGTIQVQEFAETPWTQLIFAALDYALANNSITVITGESRQGKTISAQEWAKRNNHGRSVFVTAPAYGGAKALLIAIARQVGVSTQNSVTVIHDNILRAFNKNRILIVDEVSHRLLPGEKSKNPVMLEILRDIHDRSGCALALLATKRFDSELKRGEYMFEQLLGRIGMPVRLPKLAGEAEVLPILKQYVSKPGDDLVAACIEIANKPGRLGILVETLRVASRIGKRKGVTMADAHIFAAIKLRDQMQGS